MLLVSLLGFALRLEVALTFDHVRRGTDIVAHLDGVRWTQEHWRPFAHDPSVNYGARSYPPLWYFASALLQKLDSSVRILALLSLLGWVARHCVLWSILSRTIPRQPQARFAGLAIHALLPLGVLVDGQVNPEALCSGLFALALYALWRAERQAQTLGAVSTTTAAAFGALAGLTLLAKITGALLIVVGAAVLLAQAARVTSRDGPAMAWRGVLRPALVAAGMWLVVAGWWVGHNLLEFGHPFPHVWDLETVATRPTLAEPVLYRRPLGWALPFEWREYWHFPILQSTTAPRPNFWATEIVGAWSDFDNRGFCRLQGADLTNYTWGGQHRAWQQDSDLWRTTLRCVDWLAAMVHVGVWITGAAVLALLWCWRRYLGTRGAAGSLALVLVPILVTASAMWFALAYPYDDSVPLNPRYLLSQVMPMSACLALGLAELEAAAAHRRRASLLARGVLSAMVGLILLIGAMLIYERFGA